MNQTFHRLIIVCATVLTMATTGLAEVRLPKVIGSHMVLQRQSKVRIWGWAAPGEKVSVRGDWMDKTAGTIADANGKWSIEITTLQAGRPHSLTIKGQNTLKLDDILFGEVWLASGQSNMEMPLVKVSGAYTGIKDFQKEVAAADHPNIRLFQAGNFSSKQPLDDVEPGITMYGIPPADCKWKACSPKTIPHFASTAYFFARELNKELGVPIGIIDASWGGTPAEAWTPVPGLKKLGYTNEIEAALNKPQQPAAKIPARLYNGMIHPLRKVKIRGAIWYQGEGNARRADKYARLFTTMISQWRQSFGYDFPFYYVQISPFNYGSVNSAFLRESQLDTLKLKGTAMAVTMDIGNLRDIHPKNKQEVGRRLALCALARDYGKEIVYSGPTFDKCTFIGSQAVLTFKHVGSGLSTNDGKAPSHFEIAGADGKFQAAKAVIRDNTIVVTSQQVAEPNAVRYAFSNSAMPNLINKEGLPASSFRTTRGK